MEPSWNIADVWDVVASVQPDAPAVRWGDHTLRWGNLGDRAAKLAEAFLAGGSAPGSHVALYLRNRPEYVEAFYAALSARLVPVNTNYRYTGSELDYLWRDADVDTVVFEDVFSATIEGIRRESAVRRWLCVGTMCPEWAEPYEPAIESSSAPSPTTTRSGDDLILLYTGGTTGMPKGVMWRQDDLFGAVNTDGFNPYPTARGLDGVQETRNEKGPGMTNLIACPLMHGTGLMTALGTLLNGGCLVLLAGAGFDAGELLDTVAATRADGIAIVGDTFARPIAAALDAAPHRWDLSSVSIIYSSGTMWSDSVKQSIGAHFPQALLIDALGSSEAVGMGMSVSGGGRAEATASFRLGEGAIVIDDEGVPVVPGSEVVGRLAVGGRTPLGYYKDPSKSAATFVTIQGRRYSVPGDLATVDGDGTIRLLGRGSSVINTGGEKVFAEEVEEALKTHPAVTDAGVIGIEDDRFGTIVAAVVACDDPSALDAETLRAHVRNQLASFKVPKHIVVTMALDRGPNAKLNQGALREAIRAHLDLGVTR